MYVFLLTLILVVNFVNYLILPVILVHSRVWYPNVQSPCSLDVFPAEISNVLFHANNGMVSFLEWKKEM